MVGQGRTTVGRRGVGYRSAIVAVLVGAVVAACAAPRSVAAPHRSHTATRLETIRTINASCRAFNAGEAKLDEGATTLEGERAFASGRLALVRAAETALRLPFAPSLEGLRRRVGLQLSEAEALYRRALTATTVDPLLKQAQTLLGQVAGGLYSAGAADCVPAPRTTPAVPAPPGAGELLPRGPVATVSVGPIGGDDNRIVADDRMVWVGLKNLGEMVHVDPATRRVVGSVPLGQPPSGVPQIVDGDVWVSTLDDVVRIDPATNAVDRRIHRTALGFGGAQVEVTPTAIYACNDGNLVSVDPRDGTLLHRTYLVDGCANVVVETGRVWVLDARDRIRRVDPATGASMTEPVPAFTGFQSIVVGGGAVWAFGPDTVERIDPTTGRLTGTARRPGIDFIEPCFGSGALWLASEPEQRVIRIDARTMAVTELSAGQGSNAIGCATGTVWVANSDESTVMRFDVGDLG